MNSCGRSKSGWTIFVSGLNPDCDNECILDFFSEFGRVVLFKREIDAHSGVMCDYALLQYLTKEEAEAAITHTNGASLFQRTLRSDFCFGQ